MRPGVFLLILCAILTACGSSKDVAPAPSSSVSGPLHTLPSAHPPTFHVDHPGAGTAQGYVFVGQKGGAKKPSGAVIADSRGRILWYHEVPEGREVTDFRAQTYKGKPVLTWWQGQIAKAGFGTGAYEIYDNSYHQVAELKARDGLDGDLHEFQLTPRGTAYISIYKELPYDLSSVGGPKHGWVEDSVVQELDIATGKVVFEWHSLDHVPLSESVLAHKEPALHAKKTRAFDYFHVNSVADGPNNTILLSARNSSALYLLKRDGSIAWRLGGTKSDFGPPSAVKFFFQHNARFHGPDTISLFDNGGIPKLEPYTRPFIMKIDPAAKTVHIAKTFLPPKRIASPFEGNLQLLPNGGAFVGWGGVPKVTEFSPAGKVVFQMTLPYGDTYRGYRLPWDGDPGGKPSVAVSGRTVYASWNGKLGIARWRVKADGKAIATARWAGLETAITLPQAAKKVSVEALDADGDSLGSS